MSLPKIAVTTGDPSGIGPEVCLHLLQNKEVAEQCVPIVFGDKVVLEQAADQCGLPKPAKYIGSLSEAARPCVLDFGVIALDEFETGHINAATGRAGYHYVENAIDAALSGQVAAVTTGPLNKEALRAAEIPFPGHTEIFAAKTHAQRACMLQYSSEVRCVFVTTHVAYAEVPTLLTKERILDTLELGAQAMRRIRGGEPKIGVLGLNGAGKSTLFKILTGKEEPDSGTVEIGSTVHLGYVDQSRDTLNPDNTVWQEISSGEDEIELGELVQSGSAARAGLAMHEIVGLLVEVSDLLLEGGHRDVHGDGERRGLEEGALRARGLPRDLGVRNVCVQKSPRPTAQARATFPPSNRAAIRQYECYSRRSSRSTLFGIYA